MAGSLMSNPAIAPPTNISSLRNLSRRRPVTTSAYGHPPCFGSQSNSVQPKPGNSTPVPFTEDRLQPFHRVPPTWCAWLAYGVLVAEQADLVEGPTGRQRVQPVDQDGVLSLLRVLITTGELPSIAEQFEGGFASFAAGRIDLRFTRID